MADHSPVPASDRDWTNEITDQLESVVTTVRDRTVVPVTQAADKGVFALVAALLFVVGAFFLAIILTRLLYVYLPIHPLGRRVWVSDAIVTAIFLGSGSFLWWLRRQPGRSGGAA
jgi:hypothetical protein